MEILNKKDNQVTFKATLEESLANAIRRYLNQVLVLAVDDVEIIKNGSALYDEVVAHRIGLIPLKADKAITEKTTAALKLASKKEGFVNAGELKGTASVVFENIPVTYLDKDQEIELVANAKVGKGSEHVKFSPGLLYYRNAQEIILDKNLADEIKKICPQATIKEKGDKIVIIDDKEKEICDLCEGICERNGKKAEIANKEDLIVTLESFGQMPVKEVFDKAVTALKKDLADFSKQIK